MVWYFLLHSILHAEKILFLWSFMSPSTLILLIVSLFIWTECLRKAKGHHVGHIPLTTTCRTWGLVYSTGITQATKHCYLITSTFVKLHIAKIKIFCLNSIYNNNRTRCFIVYSQTKNCQSCSLSPLVYFRWIQSS